MPKSYCHLSDLERAQIQAHIDLSRKVRAIFRTFLRSHSLISRELARCGWHGPTAPTPLCCRRGAKLPQRGFARPDGQ